MHLIKGLAPVLSLVLIAPLTHSQPGPGPLAAALTAPIPLDTQVTCGRLSNGITYYIRRNEKPEHRAELRLVVNAGSILENDSQQGLAHLVEHMAFNGTRDFKKQEIVDYLESVGVRFGADLNAYTGFDETVYKLQIPTDTPAIVEKGFDILENWAHLVSFDSVEIDKERGVVVEEWRLGRGAGARIRDIQFPVIFKDSRYAERLPIGKMDVVEHCPYDTLRQFYKDWYRPDLMAVIAVGDFDKGRIEALIRKRFSAIPPRTTERPRVYSPVPDTRGTLYTIATDPEETVTNVSIYFKHAVEPDSTIGDYRRSIVEALYHGMLNARLEELSRKADPPFIQAYSGNERVVRTKEFSIMGAVVRNGGALRGLRAILEEALRVKRFGFTPTELDREKRDLLRGMENAYDERTKTESSSFVGEYIRNFLVSEPSPGIAYEYDLYKRFLPGISLAEINRLADTWVKDDDRVVAVSAPKKEGVAVPTRGELEQTMDSVSSETLAPYADVLPDQPLVPSPPGPGSITSEHTIGDLGVTVWTLSNGVRVALKPTDFKNDEILFSGFAPGGTSLVADSDYIAALTASAVVENCGVGAFDETELGKKLAGKIVNVTPYIGDLQEGVSGRSTPQDIASMFQLVYLYFTQPRPDSSAYASYREKIKAYLQNRNARPESAFEDTIQVTMARYNARRRPFTIATLDELNMDRSLEIYRTLFADAGHFTFVIVGSFSPDQIRPLVLQYLGGLPALPRHAQWRDLGIEPPPGVVRKTVDKGIEPKSQVRLIFSGPFAWNQKNRFALTAMAGVLRIKLRETLREEKGGTYGVSVNASPMLYPRPEYRIAISFGCAPGRVDELTRATFLSIDSLKRFGAGDVYITKVKETQRRERETELKQNGFWLQALNFVYSNDVNPGEILTYAAQIDSLTPAVVRNAAREYFNEQRYVQVTLYPQTNH